MNMNQALIVLASAASPIVLVGVLNILRPSRFGTPKEFLGFGRNGWSFSEVKDWWRRVVTGSSIPRDRIKELAQYYRDSQVKGHEPSVERTMREKWTVTTGAPRSGATRLVDPSSMPVGLADWKRRNEES